MLIGYVDEMITAEEQFRELILNKRKMTSEELAYIAGFFDGEGYIGVIEYHNTHKLLVTVTNTDDSIPNLLKDFFGGTIHVYWDGNPKHRTRYTWRLDSKKAVVFLSAIQPYARQKSKHIRLALEFQMTQHHGSTPGKWGYGSSRYTDDEWEYREYLCEEMAILNKRNGHGNTSGK